ncbi:hypothetical protein ADU37_CDS20190 [Thermococcus sp. 2319x1]|nr:hypothetical protein ADU37_CDS20190 [Thermococcus sp. 2319x1]
MKPFIKFPFGFLYTVRKSLIAFAFLFLYHQAKGLIVRKT